MINMEETGTKENSTACKLRIRLCSQKMGKTIAFSASFFGGGGLKINEDIHCKKRGPSVGSGVGMVLSCHSTKWFFRCGRPASLHAGLSGKRAFFVLHFLKFFSTGQLRHEWESRIFLSLWKSASPVNSFQSFLHKSFFRYFLYLCDSIFRHAEYAVAAFVP